MSLGQIKFRNDLPLLSTLAHQCRTSAPAQHKAQRIKKDGFTGTGFPGEYIQTRLERQFQMVDDQKVANIKRAQHLDAPY